MWCICYPLKRYNKNNLPYHLYNKAELFDSYRPYNHRTREIYKHVQKCLKEYNRKSSSPYYYFIVSIDRAHKYGGYLRTGYKIEVTVGLTTIRKDKIPQRFMIFPSMFEADKTLRQALVITYNEAGSFFADHIPKEEISFDDPPYSKMRSYGRINYLKICHEENIQPDYQFKCLQKYHICPFCLINHAKLII